ncbi:hypothetical protein BaRGS_00008327 [Batillaria attramentaria]|uniref:Uncharacterized protein n=1 Tax=Batillaria attramentaria TaxID=370345 RepID=A0ABD0LLP3_9CAEN
MATGGAERNTGDDFRQTCGLCMESYRGRQPKLLPCFHTFCLPCLTTLAETAATSANTRQSETTSTEGKQQEQKSERVEVGETRSDNTHDKTEVGDASGGDSAVPDSTCGDGDGRGVSGEGSGVGPVQVVFQCPTCRSSVTVPEGGVKNLQTNFYLDHDEADDSSRASRPVPCDMCEEDQKQDATHACEECRMNLCRPCRRYHDKFPGARAHHVTPLGQGGSPTAGAQTEKKTCQNHPDQLLCFFCQKCDVSICLHCKLTSHEGHVTVDMAVASRQAKEEVAKLVGKVKEQIQVIGKLLDRLECDGRELSCKKQEVTRDVNWRYDTAVAWLTQARDEVLHDVTAREETSQRDIEADKMSARGTMERLSAVQARASLMNDSNLDLVLLKNGMQSALMSDDALEQHRSRAAVENTDCSFACESAASLFDLHIAQQYIGKLRSVGTRGGSTTPEVSFGDLTRQVVDLKTEMEKISTSLSKHIGSSDVQTADREMSFNDLRKHVVDLKAEVANNFARSDMQTASREASFNDLKKQVAEVKTNVTKITADLPKQIKDTIQKTQKPVSFHARLSSKKEFSFSETIVFDQVRYSEGGGYDPKTGIFTVPVTGTYVFLATIGNQLMNGTVFAYIVAGGVDCARAHGSSDSVGSCHVALRMTAGQKTNFYLDHDEADDTSRDSRPVPCDMCEEDQKQDATHACEECRMNLCRPCRRYHDKFPGARAHHVTPLGQGGSATTGVQAEKKTCQNHPDQLLCFFCQKCDVSICLHCKLTSHEGHVTVDMAVASRQAKEEVAKLVGKVKDQVWKKMRIESFHNHSPPATNASNIVLLKITGK